MLHKHSVTKAFIKIEAGAKFTDPRNISPRRPEFLAIIGPYIHAIEKAAGCAPFLVKGLDPEAKRRKLGTLCNYTSFYETDYSRFDRTVSQDYLKTFEIWLIEYLYPPQEHLLLHQALGMLLRTTGIHSLGFWYKTDGGRCSGDAQTSILNGLINHFNTWFVLQHLNGWTSFHEGDDGIIGCTNSCAADVGRCLPYLSAFGFKLKISHVSCLEDATFCGRFMAMAAGGVLDCADLHRALAKFHVTAAQGDLRILALAKSMSYYHTDSQTPILGWWCYCIIQHLLPRVNPHWVKRASRALKSRDRARFLNAYEAKRFERPPIIAPELVALVIHRVGWSGGVIEDFHAACQTAILNDILPVLPRLPVFDEVPVESNNTVLYSGGDYFS